MDVSWTVKKAEHWRIDAFELWCWKRLLRVLWTARRSNQSILKEINLNVHWKDWCWSWNSNILSTWCKELAHLKRPWWWERLKAGGEGDSRGWDDWMASPTRWTWVWVDSRNWWWTRKPGVLQSMGLQRVGHDWATELNWCLQGTCNLLSFPDWHWILLASKYQPRLFKKLRKVSNPVRHLGETLLYGQYSEIYNQQIIQVHKHKHTCYMLVNTAGKVSAAEVFPGIHRRGYSS